MTYELIQITNQVEVGPSSFQKVRLLGKGDVGKVYLVREKKTDKLFAMKGASNGTICERRSWVLTKRLDLDSPFKKRNGQA